MKRLLPDTVHPFYGDWLLEVERPGRYVFGEYSGRVKEDADHRMVLAFPDLYEIGMSHLGLRILYQVVNAEPDLACERAFAPWHDMEAQLRARGLPLTSLETARPLRDFDLVGFSLEYELTFTNVLTMLELGGIPVHSMARTEADPIVAAGGPVATHGEPLAPFVDLFVLGDGEPIVSPLLRLVGRMRKKGAARQAILEALDELPWCYVPALHPTELEPQTQRLVVPGTVARLSKVPSLQDVPSAWGGPVPSVSATFDRISIEIMRGCTQGCRFCQAGILYRPVRERGPSEVAQDLIRAAQETGWDEASLAGLSPADHSQIEEVFQAAAEEASIRDLSLTVSSLRAYGLSERFLDALRTGRGGGLTFAPEAGTQRLRDVINKNVSSEDLVQTAAEVSKRGWNRIKLYFMLGLPTETDEDLRAIAEVSKEVEEAARRAAPRRPPVVTASVSTFVPKPHTPFQWEDMIPLSEIQRRQGVVRAALQGSRVRVRFHDPLMSFLEGVFSRGDRALGDVLAWAYGAGCRFDGWEEHLHWDLWRQAFASAQVDPERYLSALPTSSRLSWDHVDVGIRRAFLLRERRRAREGKPTEPCGRLRPEGDRVICYGCGAPCDLQDMARKQQKLAERSEREPLTAQVPRRPTVATCRIRYAKRGVAALWGHLDLTRHLARTLRRARVPVAYSQGFHPKPRLKFSPPLSLGQAGEGELVDVELTELPVDPQTLLHRLNGVSPPGLEFSNLRLLTAREPGLGRRIRTARYRVHVVDWRREDPGEALAAFQATEHLVIEVRRRKNGKVRRVDLKQVVSELQIEVLADGFAASFLLPVQAGVGPEAAVQAIFGAEALSVTRLGFLDDSGGDAFETPRGNGTSPDS